MGVTLRYPYEVRKKADYFDDIPDEKIPKDVLDLAGHIVESKAEHFDPNEFEDQYESALKELLKRKQSGEPIEAPQHPEQSNVVNLMEACARASRRKAERQERNRLVQPQRIGADQPSALPEGRRAEMAKLGKPRSVMEPGVLEHGLRLGVSIEVIADFITRDADEIRQKADQLGILPHWKRLPEKVFKSGS